jgi:hypothetical protein
MVLCQSCALCRKLRGAPVLGYRQHALHLHTFVDPLLVGVCPGTTTVLTPVGS